MDKITLSLEVLAAILGKGREELTTALTVVNDGGEKTPKSPGDIDDYVKSSLTSRIQKAHSDGKQEGQGFATKTALTDVESFLSSEFSISEGNWKERLTALKEKFKANSGKGQLKDEEIRNSPAYIEDVKKLKEALQLEKETHQQTVANYKKKEVFNTASKKALELLNSPDNKFQIPEATKESWSKIFVQQVLSDDKQFKLDDNGNPIVLDKNGQPLRNEMLNDISFENYAIDIAKSLFPVAVSDKKETPGGNPGGQQPGQNFQSTNVPTFKTLDEYSSWYDKASMDPKVTPEVLEAAQKQLSNLEK